MIERTIFTEEPAKNQQVSWPYPPPKPPALVKNESVDSFYTMDYIGSVSIAPLVHFSRQFIILTATNLATLLHSFPSGQSLSPGPESSLVLDILTITIH